MVSYDDDDGGGKKMSVNPFVVANFISFFPILKLKSERENQF